MIAPPPTRPHSSRPRIPKRGWAFALLALVLLTPIGWGADPTYPWDSDNIAPGSVLKGMAARFAPGWYSVYGPLPYYLVAVVYAPILAAMKLTGELGRPVPEWPFGFQHPELAILVLVIGARLVTVATALTSARVATFDARPSSPERADWLVPLLLLGSIEFVHRGRTTNVDSYFVCFLWLAISLAERSPRTLRTLVAAAAAAVLAVCCKEQAGPMAAAIVSGAAFWAWRLRSGPWLARAGRASAVLASALAVYAAVWMLPFNLAGWREHHAFLFADALGSRRYALTLSGSVQLIVECLRWTPLAWGYPILAGLLLAIVLRPRLPGLGFRAWCAFAYVAGFLLKIGYVFPRFLLPLLVLALPVAVAGWGAAFERVRATRPARFALAAALALAVAAGGPVLAWLQLTDSRLPAERWIHAHARPGTVVELSGNGHLNIRVPHRYTVVRTTEKILRGGLRGPVGDYVVITSIDSSLLQRDPRIRATWWDVVHEEGGPYERAAHFSVTPLAQLVEGIWVAPEITIWRRRSAE